MTFGEKIKELRHTKQINQKDLASLMGVSLRTVAGWENDGRYPKKRELYAKLADILGCEENYLLSSEASFMTNATEQYGSRGNRQAKMILEQASAMFAGGELSDEDKTAFMDQIQQMYLDSKKRAKKYTRKDYLGKEE